MKAYQIVDDNGIDALALNEVAMPELGPTEVLMKVNASSLNYRDLLTVENPGARNLSYPRIPNSDGAGEVVAGELLLDELGVGEVLVERIDDPVAIRPGIGIARVDLRHPVACVTVAGNIEPVPSPAFTVMW